MKTVINIVLAACVIGLIYVCYGSIMGVLGDLNLDTNILLFLIDCNPLGIIYSETVIFFTIPRSARPSM